MTDTFWDEIWRDALQAPVYGPDAAKWSNSIDRRKMRFLTAHVPRQGTAVEVGCGSARLLAHVGRVSPGLTLIAVDESAVALELAQRTAAAFGLRMEGRQGTTLALPLAAASVDLVLSGGLLEHFPDPTPVLAEMLRVLRPGGVLYADVVPRKRSWYRAKDWHRMRASKYMQPGVYESALGPDDYRDRLRALGCAAVETCWCGVYPQRIQKLGPLRGALARATELLDGSRLAAALGWYFMLVTTKPLSARAAVRPAT